MNRNFEKTQFIMAVSAGDDAVMYPAGRMLSMQHEGDDVIKVYFEPGVGDGATGADREADSINLTVPDETERAVTLAILDAINYNFGTYKSKQRDYMIVKNDVDATMDNVAGITSCTITRAAV